MLPHLVADTALSGLSSIQKLREQPIQEHIIEADGMHFMLA